jgi:hypothetical protein
MKNGDAYRWTCRMGDDEIDGDRHAIAGGESMGAKPRLGTTVAQSRRILS